MPSQRTRILGIMLYLHKANGFLHWGFNFYHTQFSLKKVDPFSDTDAGGAFPAGDVFMVYPSEDGLLDSLRHEVFYDGIQDYRALVTLERLVGRECVEKILDDEQVYNFSDYPRSAEWHKGFRHRINLLPRMKKAYGQPPNRNGNTYLAR